MLMLEGDVSEKIIGHDERQVRMRLRSPILLPIFAAIPTEIVIQVQGWYKRGGGRLQPGLENDMVMLDLEEER
jgi:hypothetical protein